MRRNEDGQVLVEYILMLSLSISLLIVFQTGFRKSVFSVWRQFALEVSGGCPKGCTPSADIH